MIKKILVANRGEIAMRIFRTCRVMNIATVAIYTRVDRGALHVRYAEEAYCISDSPEDTSYLKPEKILQIAKKTGAAIHPGYGFLSENADFARRCEEEGVIFIGPSADIIARMGIKTEARRIMREAGLPIVPGTEDPVKGIAEAKKVAAEVGYPIMLKALAGGGGKGMRLVRSEEEMETALRLSQSEWESVKNIIRQNLYLSAYASEGKYNDMDMLEIGRGMSEEEDKTHFGMWCIMSSPLLIGCDLTTISEKALRLLKNEELIALNQDVLGLQAYVVKQMDGVYILTKDLEEVNGNTCAVAVYNSTDEERTIHLDFADFYLRGDVSVRDLFERRDLGKYKDRDFSVTIPAHGTRIFRLDGLERGERTIYEAECAWLQDYQEIRNHKAFETAIYEDDGNCSGGAKVTGLGNRDSNYLEWHNVYSREGGLYLMSVDYQCAENRELICQVNGVVVKNVEAHPAHEVASEQIEIRLKPGMNRIRLSNGNSWMPDIDRMVLQKK